MLSLSVVLLAALSLTAASLPNWSPCLQEGQLSELARMSGDSSEQMSYLNEQLREKDREIEELHSAVAMLTEEASRSKDDLERSQDSSSQELTRLREGQERERREYLSQVEVLVRQYGVLSSSDTVGQEAWSAVNGTHLHSCFHCP